MHYVHLLHGEFFIVSNVSIIGLSNMI
jgi:hypothetical protein